jgi:uncharacterized protein YndB with AHSA1/START domain
MTMDKSLRMSVSTEFDNSTGEVWFALTDKEMISKYLFGTETKTDWKEGSPISFSGSWNGTTYEDKGFILRIEKEKTLRYSYWSSFWGTEFNPDDLCIITYELAANGNLTKLTISQEGFKDAESRDHSVENWKSVLANIKELLKKV